MMMMMLMMTFSSSFLSSIHTYGLRKKKLSDGVFSFSVHISVILGYFFLLLFSVQLLCFFFFFIFSLLDGLRESKATCFNMV